jgi:hypothetical protein
MAQRGDLNAVAEFARNSPADQFPVDRSQAAQLTADAASGSTAGVRSTCAKVSKENALGPLCLVALTRVADFDDAFRIARILYPPRVAASRQEEDRLWVRDPVRVPTAFLSSPALAPLRRDPRFLPLAESLGLLRYWRSGRLPDFCTGTAEPVCTSLRKKAG